MADYLILIIDDDPAHHLILGNYLKKSGYDVIHALDGEHGLKMLAERKPRLVLLDVQMPGMDGFQLIRKIKKDTSGQHAAVIFLTAMKRQEIITKGLELGADDYIVKPFDRSELLARIKAVLRRMERRIPHEGHMEGELCDVGIPDLLQSMEIGMKTATIRMKEMDAEIVLKNGSFLYARQGHFTGEQALQRVFLLEKGGFSVKFNEIPSGVSGKPIPLTPILMNVTKEVDEIRDIMRQMGVENRQMIIVGDLSGFPGLEKIRHITPATFAEIISCMKGNLRDNIKILIQASAERILKIEKNKG
ncbi:MAG: response regulator [Desulfococcaceae bacterium]